MDATNAAGDSKPFTAATSTPTPADKTPESRTGRRQRFSSARIVRQFEPFRRRGPSGEELPPESTWRQAFRERCALNLEDGGLVFKIDLAGDL